MMNRLRKLLIFTFAITAIFCTFLYFIFSTNYGLRSLIYVGKKIIPGEVSILLTTGNLSQGVGINDFTYHNQGINITVKDFHFTARPWQLLRRRFSFETLVLNDVNIVIIPTSTSTASTNIENIKNLFQSLQRLEINRLTLNYHDNISFINSLAITKIENDKYSILADIGNGHITGQAFVLWRPTLNWAVELIGDNVDLKHVISDLNGNVFFKFSSNGKWDEHVQTGMIHFTQHGDLQNYAFTANADIGITKNGWNINQITFDMSEASIAIKGDINADMVNLYWNINIPQLQKLHPKWHGDLLLQGYIQKHDKKYLATAVINGHQIKTSGFSVSVINGKLNSDLSDKPALLQLHAQNLSLGSYLMPALDMTAASKLKDSALLSEINIHLNKENYLTGNVVLPNFANTWGISQALTGRLNINFSRLNNLVKVQALNSLQGQVTGQIDLKGTLDQPQYSGKILLSHGQIFIPKLGITLRSLAINANLNQWLPININGSFISGNGQGKIAGKVDIYHPQHVFQLTLTGNNLQFMQLKDYKITVSPQLHITNPGSYLNITGTVNIPFLEITTDRYLDVVELPPEVEFTHIKKVTPIVPTDLAMQVHILLGNHVYVDYKKLHASLGGSLVVSQLLGGLPTANGIVHVIDGTYEVYNQLLTIRDGQLRYVGNILQNPGLNIHAWKIVNPKNTSRWFNTILGQQEPANAKKVGALIRGTMNRPQISLISEPPMSQDDILSYLMFGETRTQLSGDSIGQFGVIASSLNLIFPNSSDSTDSTSGSDAEGLGSIFKVGLLSPVQAFNLNQRLAKYWTLQTEASPTETGIDILYEYERD